METSKITLCIVSTKGYHFKFVAIAFNWYYLKKPIMKEVIYIISWDSRPIVVEEEPYEKSEVGSEAPYLIFRGIPLN